MTPVNRSASRDMSTDPVLALLPESKAIVRGTIWKGEMAELGMGNVKIVSFLNLSKRFVSHIVSCAAACLDCCEASYACLKTRLTNAE